MFKRRLLAWLCALSLVVSVLCGAVFGAEIPNIEDMGIDPWADFEKISQVMGGSQLAPALVEDDYIISDDVGIMALSDDDAGIMPMSDITNPSWRMRMSGFAAYGVDEDGDEWEGVPVSDALLGNVLSKSYPFNLSLNSGYGCWLYEYGRPSPVLPRVPASSFITWTGRQALLSGDPDYTLNTTYSWASGTFYFDLVDWEEEAGVSSIQFIDTYFDFCLAYVNFESKDATWYAPFYASQITGGNLESVHLIINGHDVGKVTAAISQNESGYIRHYSVAIPDLKVSFEEQLVRSVSLAFNISGATLNGGMRHYSGGVGVFPFTLFNNGVQYPVVSDSARIFTGVDPSTENTGLLKGIIKFLQTIVNGIKSIGQAIVELPGKIANAIIEGIKSLFIPSEDFITQWKEDFFSMLETKFGFIYQCFEFLGNFFDEFILGWGSVDNYQFHFPGIELPLQGTTYVIVPEQDVSLDNALMDVLRPVAGTVVSIICVLAFVHSMEEMFIAILSGWSYFSYLQRKADAEREEEENI